MKARATGKCILIKKAVIGPTDRLNSSIQVTGDNEEAFENVIAVGEVLDVGPDVKGDYRRGDLMILVDMFHYQALRRGSKGTYEEFVYEDAFCGKVDVLSSGESKMDKKDFDEKHNKNARPPQAGGNIEIPKPVIVQ